MCNDRGNSYRDGYISTCARFLYRDTSLRRYPNLAYLLKYDTVYGRYPKTVEYNEDALIVDGEAYPVTHIKNPAALPWDELGFDLVFECTGVFPRRADLEKHIEAGASRVMLSAPTKSVYRLLVSNASMGSASSRSGTIRAIRTAAFTNLTVVKRELGLRTRTVLAASMRVL